MREIPNGLLPWTRSCFVCGQDNPRGLRLHSRVENGSVVIKYTPHETDLGWKHAVHGGIAMTLLDEVMTWAAMLEAGKACVSAEITCRMRAPIAPGEPIHVEGRVITAASRLLLTRGVISVRGNTVMTATGKYMPMPHEKFMLCEDDFVQSPETLPFEKILDAAPHRQDKST